MKLTPLDIQQQRFKTKWRGYDQQEVETFLELVSEDVEALLRECNSLKEELQKYETQLAEYRENERSIQRTIMTTQKLSDDLKRNAQKEADLIVSEAKVAAEKIMSDARLQAEKMVSEGRMEVEKMKKELTDLTNRKIECELSLQSMLESHLRLLEKRKEQPTHKSTEG